jgi:hypothetical protein
MQLPRPEAAADVRLLAAYCAGLARQYVCAGTDGRALREATACDGCSTGTHDTTAERLFAQCVTACSKASGRSNGEKNCFDGHGIKPFIDRALFAM